MISPFIERVVSGDKVLVNRLGKSYKVDVDNLFDSPTDDDIILVNYQGQSYKLKVNDVTSTDKDSALILVNREVNGEWKSFRSTLGELKGVAVQDVTFNVEIRTPKISWYYSANTRPGCPNPVQGEVNGGKITATVTAKSNQTYQFQNGTLYIDGEWILCCGSTGDTGFSIDWAYRQLEGDYEVCYTNGNNQTTQQSKGLSAVGVGNIGPGQASQDWGNGPAPNSSGTYGQAGAGGFGCPAGNRTGTNNRNPGEGGYSQSRPRAEDSGDTWNDITVTNIVHSNGRWDGYNAISANGITLTNNSGVIGDLIPAPATVYSDTCTLLNGTDAGGASDPKNVFDGDLTTKASGTYPAQVNDEYAIYDISTPNLATSSVGIRIGGLRQEWEFTINKGRADELKVPITGAATDTLSFNFTGNVYSLHMKITSTDGSGFSVFGTLIDGVYLVDP